MRSFVRPLLALLALSALFLGFRAPVAAEQAPHVLRIGYQKTGDLVLVKRQGALEAAFAKSGTAVQWVQFPSGPPLLEALDAGSIDLGYTGDTPPIFAQAAGAHLVYVASVPSPGRSSAILVHRDSAIRTLADLRGKRVAVTRGSSAHNVLVRALAKAGLAYTDITPVYVQPADAAAAFRSGSVDAWSIWDPFYAIAQQDPDTRVLSDAVDVAPSNSFYLARKDFALAHPATIAAVVAQIDHVSRWADTHRSEVAQLLAAETGVALEVARTVVDRTTFGVHTITPAVVRQQQAIADDFLKLGLIPHPIDVAAAVWTPSKVAHR